MSRGRAEARPDRSRDEEGEQDEGPEARGEINLHINRYSSLGSHFWRSQGRKRSQPLEGYENVPVQRVKTVAGNLLALGALEPPQAIIV